MSAVWFIINIQPRLDKKTPLREQFLAANIFIREPWAESRQLLT